MGPYDVPQSHEKVDRAGNVKSILQISKPRPREGKWLAQAHSRGSWPSPPWPGHHLPVFASASLAGLSSCSINELDEKLVSFLPSPSLAHPSRVIFTLELVGKRKSVNSFTWHQFCRRHLLFHLNLSTSLLTLRWRGLRGQELNWQLKSSGTFPALGSVREYKVLCNFLPESASVLLNS